VGDETARKSDGKALLLVVERDPHIRTLERYFLEQAGFVVEFSDDGVQGLERARTLRPDILITEILVPHMDGLAVCRTIKGDPATRHILVLVFSILFAEDRARAAGADAFVRKPLDDRLLIESVEKLLAQRAQGVV
jgi:two-component system response regulator MprA